MRMSIVPALLALGACHPAAPSPPSAPAAPAEDVWQAASSQSRADDLLRDYSADPVSTDGRIDGKSVAVFGRVRLVDANLSGVSHLSLGAGAGPDDRVACSFEEGQAGTLVDVQPGDWAVVVGLGRRAARIERCRLLKTFTDEEPLQRWLRAVNQVRPVGDLH